MPQAQVFKRIMDALKELVTDANFDCSATGLSLQAMDSSHVSLVALQLRSESFEQFRCDRNMSLGINLASMSKILKCATGEDVMTIRAEDNADTVTFMFESPKKDRISEFELKLMDIDSEHLGIPDTHYKCVVKMPSAEFQRIVREISILGDTVTIHATKEGLKFSVAGEMGSGNIMVRQDGGADSSEDEQTTIELEEEVALSFALSHLNHFAKASSLSPTVTLSLSKDVPLVVEYKIGDHGHIRFYLAPKIDDK